MCCKKYVSRRGRNAVVEGRGNPFQWGKESLLPAVRASCALARSAVPGTGVSCRPRCTCSRARASVLAEVAADEPDLTLRRQVPTVEGQFLGGKLYQQFRAAEDGRLPPSCRCVGQHVRGNLLRQVLSLHRQNRCVGAKNECFWSENGWKRQPRSLLRQGKSSPTEDGTRRTGGGHLPSDCIRKS